MTGRVMGKAFPLATVLRVRGIEEEVARGHLAVALAGEAAAGRARLQAQQAYDALPAAVDVSLAGFLTDRARRSAFADGVAQARVEQARAVDVVGGARQDWGAAAMRLSALERLAERAREVRRLELLATEQRTGEESAAAVLAGRTRR